MTPSSFLRVLQRQQLEQIDDRRAELQEIEEVTGDPLAVYYALSVQMAMLREQALPALLSDEGDRSQALHAWVRLQVWLDRILYDFSLGRAFVPGSQIRYLLACSWARIYPAAASFLDPESVKYLSGSIDLQHFIGHETPEDRFFLSELASVLNIPPDPRWEANTKAAAWASLTRLPVDEVVTDRARRIHPSSRCEVLSDPIFAVWPVDLLLVARKPLQHFGFVNVEDTDKVFEVPDWLTRAQDTVLELFRREQRRL